MGSGMRRKRCCLKGVGERERQNKRVNVVTCVWDRWINPVWINGLKSAGVRALEFPPPPDHTRTLARDVPPVHRLTTCWAPRRTSPSLIPHLSPSIRHSTPLLPSYWSLSFLTALSVFLSHYTPSYRHERAQQDSLPHLPQDEGQARVC